MQDSPTSCPDSHGLDLLNQYHGRAHVPVSRDHATERSCRFARNSRLRTYYTHCSPFSTWSEDTPEGHYASRSQHCPGYGIAAAEARTVWACGIAMLPQLDPGRLQVFRACGQEEGLLHPPDSHGDGSGEPRCLRACHQSQTDSCSLYLTLPLRAPSRLSGGIPADISGADCWGRMVTSVTP